MTENEAKILLCQMYLPQFDEKEKQALTMAIKALEEIQQYRAIGTVEELKTMKENGAFTGIELAHLAAVQMKMKKYQTIGTVDEFKALKEKSVAKKPEYAPTDDTCLYSEYVCPNCYIRLSNFKEKYCQCGQKLDFGEE